MVGGLGKSKTTTIRAPLTMCSGCVFVALSDSVLKLMLADVSALRILWIRSFFIVIFVLVFAFRIGFRKIIRSNHRLLHLVRVIFGVIGTIFFFQSLRYLPLTTAIILSFLTPLLVNVLAAALLGEKIHVIHVAATLAGLLGTAIIVWQPQINNNALSLRGMAYGVIASLSLALAWTIVRRIRGADHILAFLLFLNIGTLAAGLLATAGLGIIPPFKVTSTAAAMAVLVLAGNFLMIKAYVMAEAISVAPFIYSQVLWATVLQLAIWHELPTMRTAFGAVVIIAAGLILTAFERRRHRLNEPAEQ